MTLNDKPKTGAGPDTTDPRSGVGADDRNRIDAALGRRVRRLREDHNLPLEHLAGFVRISGDDLRGYEEGRLRIPAAVLFQIAMLLQQPVAAFYDGLEES